MVIADRDPIDRVILLAVRLHAFDEQIVVTKLVCVRALYSVIAAVCEDAAACFECPQLAGAVFKAILPISLVLITTILDTLFQISTLF